MNAHPKVRVREQLYKGKRKRSADFFDQAVRGPAGEVPTVAPALIAA